VLLSETLSSTNSYAGTVCGPHTIDSNLHTVDSTLINVSNSSRTTDIDCDSLKNWEENKLYGTNIEIADTDSDGLDDGDEIFVYGTDPLNPDSDDDTFLDGHEVLVSVDPVFVNIVVASTYAA